MLQNPRKTLGFKKNMVYKIPPGGGGKPYPASGLSGTEIQNQFPVLTPKSSQWTIPYIRIQRVECIKILSVKS